MCTLNMKNVNGLPVESRQWWGWLDEENGRDLYWRVEEGRASAELRLRCWRWIGLEKDHSDLQWKQQIEEKTDLKFGWQSKHP